MADKEFGFNDRVLYAFKNGPQSADPLGGFMNSIMWAMGAPSNGWGLNSNLNQYFFDQAVSRGQNPVEVLPWLNKGASSSSSSSAAPKNPLAGMPQWYQEWYNKQGRYGGLLDG